MVHSFAPRRSALMYVFSRPAKSRTRRAPRILMATGIAAFALIISACGATTTSGGQPRGTIAPTATATVSCPSSSTVASWHLVTSGSLTIASDTTYAPAEYADPTNPSNYIGYDMDLAREFARRLCLTANIEKATFGDIIP